MFKIEVAGDQAPVDAKKFVGEDTEMKDVELCDALFHRLTVQVKKYSWEESGSVTSSKDIRKKIKNKDDDPTRVKGIFEVLHIFELK